MTDKEAKAMAQEKALQALHNENERLGLYEDAYAEPVAWMDADGNVSDNNDHKCFPIPLYTTPPQRKPLTDDLLTDLWYKQSLDWMEFARAIEAAHDIKETT